ncbi:MAG: ABC transporter ATP-binding protein [Deltaproteobacteria bacterium]|nr:ABC transporter ATP-binding protein [Deltaproteobacteria bacterium]
MVEAMLDVKNISLAFDGLKALDNVSLCVEEGRIFSLIGPNGAGKTTLFNVITGSLRPDGGQVRFMGKDITGLKPYLICREGIARTFQLRNTFPNLSVFDNIMAGMLKEPIGRRERREKVLEIMEFLGIGRIAEAVVSNIPPLDSKLVELARALATNPKLILLDELISGLLPSETDRICDIIETLREKGLTILQIGHEIKPIMRTSDRIFVLDQGHNVADGPPEEIKNNKDVLSCYLE